MKKITNIKAVSANLMVLTPSQMLNVKGGIDYYTYSYSTTSTFTGTTTTSILTDDKRRDRPGGGITTL